MSIKKTGKNKFSNYDYYELGDFLPYINEIFNTHKLISIISFTTDCAELKIINAEKPDEVIIFTSPHADATLKGCHPIQNLGATQTYQRRYLYITALEIVESDIIDETTDTNKEIKTYLSDAQTKRLYAIGKKAGIEGRQINDLIKKELNKDPKELTKAEYDAYCSRLEKKASKE
jgi:hypothetical protein